MRPSAVAGSRFDLFFTIGCVATLCGIFILEVVTPKDVVDALTLLPLAAGAWMLSNRMAGVVLATGALLLTAAVLVETENRLTSLLIGIPTLITAGGIRLYAASLRQATPGDLRDKPRSVGPRAERHGDGYVDALTRRELEVARLAARAYTAAEIGHQLHIGERTVESHIASTYLKLGLKSRSELIRIASRLG
jgi:DNA-binding CsgD family transcriptional regulator